jgi:hypothetical protein
MRSERIPWRLGTTSFIRPGSWLENARWLARYVQDVELLCFEAGSLPDAGELAGLRAVREEHGLSYCVHTPLSASLASAEPRMRRAGIDEIRRVFEHMEVLGPSAYVVHVYWGDHEHDARPPSDLAAWRERARESLAALVLAGMEPSRICVESLDYDYAFVEPVAGTTCPARSSAICRAPASSSGTGPTPPAAITAA